MFDWGIFQTFLGQFFSPEVCFLTELPDMKKAPG